MPKPKPEVDVIVPPPPTPEVLGLEAQLAAALRERDAARTALDAALMEPCTLCGKQRKDTP